MRYIFLIALACFIFSACKKDKFTTVPQISYKSIKPNVFSANIPIGGQVLPVLTFHITDAEGDLGIKSGKDTAFVYVRNVLSNTSDSFLFPNISSISKSNFEADVDISISTGNLLKGSTRPRPKTDTVYYEIYVKDFAKNKSNTIVAGDPLYYVFH